MRQLFVGAPLTALLGKGQRFDPLARAEIEVVLRFVADRGWQASNAHLTEKWGEEILAPGVTLVRDLTAIDAADAAVFLLLDAPSPGMNLEIGYSLATRKPILLLGDHPRHLGFLGEGLVQSGMVRRVHNLDALAEQLDQIDHAIHV